ncbi:EscU/YscU/HrcU family type III secretion system export apparatus switch protein [Marinitoga aeolica]|uniref:EscU/YscU/HrcU family type III secretion system export apparatus switch protein n=1 Tax=Marinitoga aeolica TaxID=2809031 RepID=A0ABY8PT36_9BACT|nr:EscU/YscU/HrcU family type III secretion system export apparatus switch protein [Marinitoga aeolica]WGS65808.1 EscU/YscU/HrcU family type III secretion system export apparatus switch protein [Marinitoga aeolica]
MDKKVVAIKYKDFKDEVPTVIAKGTGIIAEKIIEIAKENNIPILKNTKTVNELYSLDIPSEIPEEMYFIVAKIIAYVMKLNEKEEE